MVSVPIQTLPTQSLEPGGGVTPFSGGQGITPVRDATGDQIKHMGDAEEKLGISMMHIANRLQSEYDDARHKQMYNEFAGTADNIELDYSKLYGADAARESTNYSTKVASELDRIAKTADNPLQEQMFRQSASVKLRSSNLSLQTRAVGQQREFDLGESSSQLGSFVNDASKHWQGWNNPNSDFSLYRAAAIQSTKDLAEKKGLAEGTAQREKMVLDTQSAITSQVVQNMGNDNKFIDAQKFLDEAFEKNEVDAKTFQSLQNQIAIGYRRQSGIEQGSRIYRGLGKAGSTDYNNILDWVLVKEGGYSNDRFDSGGPTMRGITQKEYNSWRSRQGLSAQSVRNIGEDELQNIYKRDYWDAVGADELSPDLRAAAFDAAVNQGVPTAKRLLAQAGGDFNKFIELRKERYDEIITNNPSQEKFRRSWYGRLKDLVAAHKQNTPATGEDIDRVRSAGMSNIPIKQPGLQDMIAATDSIEDPQEKEFATAYIKDQYNNQVAVANENYKVLLQQAQDVAYSKIGGWQSLPANVMAQLKPEDRKRMVEGAPRGDDPDTKIKLLDNPELWKKGNIEQFRGLLSESTYESFYAKGNKSGADQRMLDAKIDADQFHATLLRNNMQNLINPKKGSTEQAQVIQLRDTFEKRIDAEQQNKGKKLNLDERQKVLDGIFMDKVYTPGYLWSTEKPLFSVPTSDLNKVYTYVDGKDIKADRIPAEQRRLIISALQQRGQRVTEQSIAQIWVQQGSPK